MENDKYFTPDIEDFHVGYECEILKENWEHFIFNVEEIIPVFARVNSKTIVSDKIRVPYLTKEQIEAEGWKLDSSPDSNEMHFIKKIKKSRHYLEFYPNTTEVIINKINTESLPFKCKDINTFRKIIKLL